MTNWQMKKTWSFKGVCLYGIVKVTVSARAMVYNSIPLSFFFFFCSYRLKEKKKKGDNNDNN